MARSAWEVAADLIKPPTDSWRPEPHQIPPAGNWYGWLLMGGRGSGKTAAAARYMHDHVHGPPCLPDVPGGHWPGIIAPTLGDGVTSCIYGPSGLRVHDPGVKAHVTPGGTIARWSNGVEAKIFGASTPEDVERLRSGGNRCFVWLEELAAWRLMEDCFKHMRFGLRVGPWPHWVGSTTPKSRPLIKRLVAQGTDPNNKQIVLTRATTRDNPHLMQITKDSLFEEYGGTRLGRQELEGELLEDIEGALWSDITLELNRMRPIDTPDYFDRIVVAVDPPAKSTGAECGIVVIGKRTRYNWPNCPLKDVAHGFVLADYSRQGSPDTWASAVLTAYKDWGANYIVAEVNNGGDMVKSTIQSKDGTLPVKVVHATRGKAKRAEPIAGLYEQFRVHHIGVFGKLEDQMTSWDPEDEDAFSPDRMDALVWGASELLLGLQEVRTSPTQDNRLAGRR